MTIRILDNCPACGACLMVCPVKALAISGSKLTVNESCIECGLCIQQCPVQQLVLPKDTPSPSPAGKGKGKRSEDIQAKEVKNNAKVTGV
ncbi:hypothetical protein Sgly_0777 [Syntrophobotulus glycolicus DSM 8271]|uniref:4Fe-4S ferredoxin-type domain-containing protein n=1 Tax=Syntrophobotulus glycolicus (strain DSM 8271 / FlGlyR) TaxID=645991 RepID=F0T170_SYNGF|nr:4Fe-4S dicluster domain-containing protein [Syntrophobotulus glycolicus]ADY55134.1 hypothetical protein Sgly_0777 [Syntrophobotulus glycolicus DSM 8271]